MQEAVCKNKIASIRLLTRSRLDAKIVHRKGGKTTFWDRVVGLYRHMKEYDDTVIKYNEEIYTLNNLSKYLCCCLEVTNDNEIYVASQVVIHYQDTPWKGSVESKYFKTDEEAIKFFNTLVEENNLDLV